MYTCSNNYILLPDYYKKHFPIRSDINNGVVVLDYTIFMYNIYNMDDCRANSTTQVSMDNMCVLVTWHILTNERAKVQISGLDI